MLRRCSLTTQAYVTDEVKSYIGKEGPEIVSEPIEASEVRRFTQAIMDPDPIHWNVEYTKKTRYGAPVAPPLFGTHWFRTPAGVPDPLSENFKKDPEFDGLLREKSGPPMPPMPLKRTLNGGNDIEFFRYPKVGERVKAKGKIVDIYEREGRSGRMVFIITDTTFRDEKGGVLMISRQTLIRR